MERRPSGEHSGRPLVVQRRKGVKSSVGEKSSFSGSRSQMKVVLPVKSFLVRDKSECVYFTFVTMR